MRRCQNLAQQKILMFPSNVTLRLYMLSLWWFASRKELFSTKWGPEKKAVLSVTDKMLSDASCLLVQVDVKTVNIPVR